MPDRKPRSALVASSNNLSHYTDLAWSPEDAAASIL